MSETLKMVANDVKKAELNSETFDERLAARVSKHKSNIDSLVDSAVNFQPVLLKVKNYLTDCSLSSLEFAKLVDSHGYAVESLSLAAVENNLVRLRVLDAEQSKAFMAMFKMGYAKNVNVHAFCRFIDNEYTKQKLEAVKDEQTLFEKIRNRQFDFHSVDSSTKVAL